MCSCPCRRNFPPDKASCSYGVLVNAFKKIAGSAGLSAAEKEQVFAGTAMRVYRIGDGGGEGGDGKL